MVDNRGPQLAGISAGFVAIALVSTLLRCYVRTRIVRAFGLDDYFMVAAMLTYIWYTSSVLGGIHHGTGRHMLDLSADSTKQALRYWWNCYLSYCLGMTLAKISIGLFLLRVTVSRLHRGIMWTVMTITAVTGIIFFFVTLFQCKPVQFFWTKVYPDSKGSCIDIEIIINLTYVYGSICAVCDFTFGLLPIFLVWNLNMDRKTKIMLVPILGMACIASSAVIVRMPYIQDFEDPDFLYATVDIAIWSTTEVGLAISAGSLACLRPLYRRFVERLTTNSKGNSSFGPSGSNNVNSPYPHTPSSKRSRRGVFSLSNLTTRGTHQDAENLDDYDFPLPAKGAPYGDDQESQNRKSEEGSSGSASGKGYGGDGERWKIYVTEDFNVQEHRRHQDSMVINESQRDLTAFPRGKGIAL